MSNPTTRRDFLRLSVAAAAGLATAGRTFAQKPKSPNDRIRYAIVGVGGKGWSGTEWAARTGDIVALCDIDATTLDQGAEVHPKASKHRDYRRLFEDHHDEFDAVVISTPDHHHAFASSMAMKQGKHVYCEKPLTRTLGEARHIINLAKKTKLATQMGNQGSAESGLRRGAALIKSGVFGAVKEVHVWTDRPIWPQGVPRAQSKPVPENVDWDIWLGPSLDRSFGDNYHSFSWRGWWDFGSGALGDMACHYMNMPFRAADLRDPISVQAKTSGHNRDSFPSSSVITYEFAATKSRGPVTMVWYDGRVKPPQELAPGVNLAGNGSIVVCEHATVISREDHSIELVGGAALPPVEFEVSPGHMEEFARAIMGGPPALSNFVEYAGPLTETVLLGNLAVWADGSKLEWDARRQRVKGTREYDSLIRPNYRPGWKL
ncbi:MAG: Gfo/Idh/MocA family protein [Fimbriimonas sp.]